MIPSPKVEAVALVDDAALIIIASLAAFGIAVTAQGGIDTVAPWIVDQFEEFVDSVGDTVSTVWDKFRAGVTKAGELVLDGFTLRYNSKFGEWLVNKFSLTDNSSYVPPAVIEGAASIRGFQFIPLTSLPSTLYRRKVGYTWYYKHIVSSTSPSVYISFYRDGTQSIHSYLVDTSSTSVTVQASETHGDTTTYQNYTFTSYSDNPFTIYNAQYTYEYYSPYKEIIQLGYQRDSFLAAFSTPVNSSEITLSGSFPVDLSSGTLDVPGVGDYDDNDGILIDGLGSWGDSLDDVLDNVGDLTLPGSSVVTDGDVSYTIAAESELVESLVDVGQLTTENSPGMFSPKDSFMALWNYFRPTSLWDYVISWVDSMSSGLALIGGIMFSLPFVGAFYAVLALTIIYSLWRFLRDT